ncbi:MAG: hypothetical protein AAGE79_01725 [Acinetobacter pittii]
MIDLEFNFEENTSNKQSFLNDLKDIDVLWRLAKKDNTHKFYLLRLDRNEEAVSLYDLNNDFLERNNKLCYADCFLGFMFFVVFTNPPRNIQQMKKKLAVTLLKNRLSALVQSNDIFLEKISYIRATPVLNPRYAQANHWDMKYVEDKYCEDDDIIELLFNCSEMFEITDQLKGREDLVV